MWVLHLKYAIHGLLVTRQTATSRAANRLELDDNRTSYAALKGTNASIGHERF